jgi:hypothetical protein
MTSALQQTDRRHDLMRLAATTALSSIEGNCKIDSDLMKLIANLQFNFYGLGKNLGFIRMR